MVNLPPLGARVHKDLHVGQFQRALAGLGRLARLALLGGLGGGGRPSNEPLLAHAVEHLFTVC